MEGRRSAAARPPVRVLHAGLAGAGWEPVRSVVQRALAEEGLADDVRVGTDVEAAFHDAFGRGSGLLVLAGTGSVAWGRSEEGRTGRVGGWGGLLGDEGSGWSVGLGFLRAVARAVDGRGPPTRLVEEVVGHLDLTAPEELMSWVGGASKAEVARLVELVRRTAAKKDAVAMEILRRAVRDLEAHVTTLARSLGPWTTVEDVGPTVVLPGGLLEAGGVLRADLQEVLEGRGMEVAARVPDPVRGAAALARLDRGERSPQRGRGRERERS